MKILSNQKRKKKWQNAEEGEKSQKNFFNNLETLVTRYTLLNSKNHDLGDQNFIAAKGQLH